MDTIEKNINTLIEQYGVFEETIDIITNINWYNNETLEDILYVVAWLRSFDEEDNEI